MRVSPRSAATLIFLTLLAGVLGGWLGVTFGRQVSREPHDLHGVIHHDLDLTQAQNDQIEALEQTFKAQRKSYDAQMRAANHDLAVALDADHKFGPREQAAVDRFHLAEKALEVATIRHVLAMRAVLGEGQSKKFDKAIYEALTAAPS